jgi:hypothetical protein
VIGRSLIANSAEELFDGTNAVVLSFLTGKSDPDTPPEPAMSVHVDDVALAHVLALDKEKIPSTAGVGNYLVAQSKPFIHTPRSSQSVSNPQLTTDITRHRVG